MNNKINILDFEYSKKVVKRNISFQVKKIYINRIYNNYYSKILVSIKTTVIITTK